MADIVNSAVEEILADFSKLPSIGLALDALEAENENLYNALLEYKKLNPKEFFQIGGNTFSLTKLQQEVDDYIKIFSTSSLLNAIFYEISHEQDFVKIKVLKALIEKVLINKPDIINNELERCSFDIIVVDFLVEMLKKSEVLNSLKPEILFKLAFHTAEAVPELVELAIQKSGDLSSYLYYIDTEKVINAYVKYKEILLKQLSGDELIHLAFTLTSKEIDSVARQELLDLALVRKGDVNHVLKKLTNIEVYKEVKDWVFAKATGDSLVSFFAQKSSGFSWNEEVTEEILQKGIAKGGNLILLFTRAIINNHPEIRDKYIKQITNYDEAMELAISYGLTEAVMYLSNELGVEVDLPLIGMTNSQGEWSPNVEGSLRSGTKFSNVKFLRVETEEVEDAKFMSLFHGFINPGAGDMYPKDKNEFALSDIAGFRHDESYQDTINHAVLHHKPYIGFCAGNQHLALNRDGKLKPVSGYSNDDHKAHFEKGSISYFYTLSVTEQHALLKSCMMPEVTIHNIHTAHGYAVVNNSAGVGVQIGALSEEGVVQSIAASMKHVGFQFHPEDYYSNDSKPGVNREKIIIDNYFKMVMQHHAAFSYAKQEGMRAEVMQAKIDEAEGIILTRLAECKAKPVSPFSTLFEEFDVMTSDNYHCLVDGSNTLDIFNNLYWIQAA